MRLGADLGDIRRIKNGQSEMLKHVNIATDFGINEQAVLYHGSWIDLLKKIPDNSVQLIVTSPPYNIGKEYEIKNKIKQLH